MNSTLNGQIKREFFHSIFLVPYFKSFRPWTARSAIDRSENNQSHKSSAGQFAFRAHLPLAAEPFWWKKLSMFWVEEVFLPLWCELSLALSSNPVEFITNFFESSF